MLPKETGDIDALTVRANPDIATIFENSLRADWRWRTGKLVAAPSTAIGPGCQCGSRKSCLLQPRRDSTACASPFDRAGHVAVYRVTIEQRDAATDQLGRVEFDRIAQRMPESRAA